jgi:hypothetical protein
MTLPEPGEEYRAFLTKFILTYKPRIKENFIACFFYMQKVIFFKPILKTMYIFVSSRDNFIYHDCLNSKITAHSMKEKDEL